MIELRFHRSVYRSEAVDEAARAFERFAAIERVEEGTHWVLRVSAKSAARERQVAGELGNYALGATVKQGGSPA